ncbi:MAG: hypothetical protein H6624_12445 [Bdellovibrionaceae bacterium]|nr:hypothetical protein [Bdellovibrionales bacterium]MCB9085153.1 hypothetical protein [Pseudobdellovibrionaceae bacterium]
MNCLILILFLLGAQLPAQAGNQVGNGGDAIVCGEKVFLLDYYEAKANDKIQIQLEKGKDHFEIAGKTVDRLEQHNPQLHKQYRRVLEKIGSRLRFIDNANFRDVKDSFELTIPKGCKLEQLAIQRDEGGLRLIHISKSLWEKLSKEHQAGLLLHEIVYEHFLFLGETDSVKARKFNSFVSAKDFKTLPKEKYQKFVRSLKMPIY